MSEAVTPEESPKRKAAPLRAFGAPRPQRGHRPEGRVDGRRRKKFKLQTRELPKRPGVYFFYGHQDRLLYIGKAKSLRERVRSYFADTSLPRPPKIRRLLTEISRFAIEECGSELEALLLERRLIAELQPPVNHQLKQFEIYPYLLLTDEAFPRLTFTRAEPVGGGQWAVVGGQGEVVGEDVVGEEEADFFAPPAAFATAHRPPTTAHRPPTTAHRPPTTAHRPPTTDHYLENPPRLGEVPGFYLGPFTTAHAARWTLEAVRNLFPLRTCEGELQPNPAGKSCFLHEIKRCAAPCVAAVSREEYAALCADLVRALETGEAPQIEKMRARMLRFAEDLRFEDAQELKLQLQGLEAVAARLGRLTRMRAHDVAIVQPARRNAENTENGAALFLVRGGLVRRHIARVDDWNAAKDVLREVYTAPLPSRPFTAKHELDEMMILDRWLSAHGAQPCCVPLRDLSSRQWAAVAVRQLQKAAERQN